MINQFKNIYNASKYHKIIIKVITIITINNLNKLNKLNT